MLANKGNFPTQIRSTILQLRELQDRPDADQGRIDELTNRVEWDTRIFEERRKTMSFVCEVPVLIEQQLFALARAIQQSLECRDCRRELDLSGSGVLGDGSIVVIE